MLVKRGEKYFFPLFSILRTRKEKIEMYYEAKRRYNANVFDSLQKYSILILLYIYKTIYMKERISTAKVEQNKLQELNNQEDITSTNTSVSEKLKALMSAVMISSSVFVASNAIAKTNMTEEQVAQARATASQMKIPIDFDAMIAEASRLGVECDGDLTRKVKIATCDTKVKRAQSQERQAALVAEGKRLDEEGEKLRTEGKKLRAENDALREEIVKIVQDTKQIAKTM